MLHTEMLSRTKILDAQLRHLKHFMQKFTFEHTCRLAVKLVRFNPKSWALPTMVIIGLKIHEVIVEMPYDPRQKSKKIELPDHRIK